MREFEYMEALIKSGMQIAQTDFSFDCMKTTQEYLMYFKEFSCNQAENMQARCVPDLISASIGKAEKAAAPADEGRAKPLCGAKRRRVPSGGGRLYLWEILPNVGRGKQ